MLCPHCGADTPAPGGRCTQCSAALPPRSPRPTVAATLTPLPPPDAPTVLGTEATVLGNAETVLGSEATVLGAGSTVPPGGAGEGPLEPGQPFGARYRILRVLGAGGMGVVYQAWDQELGVAVALKVIRPEVVADPHSARDVERRFKRELLLARQVTHRNVVRIHDLGEVDGIKYITMPFIEGSSLARALTSKGRLPVSEALPIARDIASGLAAAHEAGVVHRDLKPENVMLESDGHAVIMDFGISRSASPQPRAVDKTTPTPNRTATFDASALGAGLTMAGTVVGTLDYMAPEQARAEPVDQRADIYSFGMILRDALLGLRRGGSGTAIAELMARIKEAPPSIRTVDPELPEAVDRIVARCLEPDPAARYQTTQELLADLNRLDDEGQPLPEPRKFTRRHAIAAGIAFTGIVSGTYWLAQPAPPEVQPPPTSVLIADFDNQAGDPVFDGALEQALALAMEDAPFITVYPRADARRAAAQTIPSWGGKVNREVGLLLAGREGLNYLIAGRIQKKDDGYLLTVEVEAPSDNSTAGTDRRPAITVEREISSKQDVLGGVGEAAAQVLRRLGKTDPAKTPFAPETVTAASLQAMNAYARGQDLSLAGKPLEALKAYQEAVSLDPSFGRAYSGMGVVYGNLKRISESDEAYKKALPHLNRMTEREQHRTLGSYSLLVSRDYQKAADSYEALVSKYPADNAGHANLAIAYLQLRKVGLAMIEGRKAIDIYPRNLLQRTNYSMYAMYAGDFGTSIAQATQVLKDNPSLDFALLTLARAQLGAGDVQAARQAYTRLASLTDVGASQAALGLADLEMYLGRYKEAVGILERGIAADEKAGSQHDMAVKLVALAESHMALGRTGPGLAAARRAIRIGGHESVLFPAGRILLDAKQEDELPAVISALERMLQTHTTAYARLLEGEQALRRGRFVDGLEPMRQASERHDAWFVRYVLGRAYLEAGSPVSAIQEFEQCVKRKGEAVDAFVADASTLRYFPSALYWLGRAHEAVGSVALARANYAEYLKIRKDANPPDPLAADAARRSGT